MLGPLIIAFFVLLYAYVWKKHQYFKNFGIPHEPGYFPFGSKVSWRALTGQVAFLNIPEEIYPNFPNAKVCGYYGLLGEPILVIRDLEIVKRVMIKDFNHFIDRNIAGEWIHPESNKHFSNMLTVLQGDKWRAMRSILTPIFTSGKIKATMPMVNQAAEELTGYLEKIDKENIVAKEVFQMYTGEVLGKLGCGIDPKVFRQLKDNVFYDQAIKLTGGGKPSIRQVLVGIGILLFPQLCYYFKAHFLPQDTMEFFDAVLKKSIKSRQNSREKKNDFIDLFSEALNNLDVNHFSKTGYLTEEQKEDLIVSNALLLFFAGQDTTSSGISVTFHHLAKNPDVQEKLYQEISDAIEENNGDPNLDYNKLHSLIYLEKVLKESLRLWGFSFYGRKCRKEYFIEEIGFTVPNGMQVISPSSGIMKEDEHYKDPLKFDPDAHFEGDSSLYSSTFMVFGIGPRNCVGMRFAFTMMRACMVHTLAKYRILPNSKTINDWVIDPMSPAFLPKGGINVKLEARK